MKGKAFEHTFASDGTVTYQEVGGTQAAGTGNQPGVRYEVARIDDDVYAVSYLSSAGWTLTTVVDTKARTIVSFASNDKQLIAQRGTLEI